MAHIVLEPELIESPTGTGRWCVVIYDNDVNSMDEVIEILMRSTGCTLDEAYIEMWEAHTYGKAQVHFGAQIECVIVATMISSIGVRTQVVREWLE